MDWALVKCEVFTGNLMRGLIEPSRKDGEPGFYFCLDTSGFNEMILPPASPVSPPLPCVRCQDLSIPADNRKCLDSICSPSRRKKVARSVDAQGLRSTRVIGHDSPKTVYHTHSELFPSTLLYKYSTHLLFHVLRTIYPCDITWYPWQEMSRWVINVVRCGLSKESLNL